MTGKCKVDVGVVEHTYSIDDNIYIQQHTHQHSRSTATYAAHIEMNANLLRLRPGALFNSFFWFLDIKLGMSLRSRRR